MTLSLLPHAPEPSPRRPGRPRVADDPERRLLHLAVAADRIVNGRLLKQVAFDFDISHSSAKRWTRAALRYDGPLADRLREAAGAKGRRRGVPGADNCA